MELTGIIYSIGAAITWGLVYTIDQKILGGISPITLLFIDSILTFAVIIPFILIDRASIITFVQSGALNIFLVIISLILALVANYFIYSGIKLIGASTASVFEISYPLFVVLFSYLFFRSSMSVSFWIGTGLIFIGSIVILKF